MASMMRKAFIAALEGGEPLPADMAAELLSAFQQVEAGVKAPLFTPNKSSGHREDPFAKDLIGYAVGYLEAPAKDAWRMLRQYEPLQRPSTALSVDGADATHQGCLQD
ncbi:MAG: hypothetical protein ACREVT_01245 [Burkholderiales bacterium]